MNVNSHVGKNIPADLYHEHLLCKTAVQNLGPNKTSDGIVRVQTLRTLSLILNQYDEITAIESSSGAPQTRI